MADKARARNKAYLTVEEANSRPKTTIDATDEQKMEVIRKAAEYLQSTNWKFKGDWKLPYCRICAGGKLTTVIDLGEQAFSGIFPKPGESVPRGELRLVRCSDCGLVQLGHTYDLNVLYGETYGYRSGLNQSMVRHLGSIVAHAQKTVELSECDTVIDIGSNDGTLLSCYPKNLRRIGVDPLITKFGHFYEEGIEKLPKFFSADAVRQYAGEFVRAKIVTSIACFYDLPDPSKFVEDVKSILSPDGVWIFEQSYLPLMVGQNAYDTICHEHLEYYTLRDVDELLRLHGLKIIDLDFNDTNGGSFRVTAAYQNSRYEECQEKIDSVLTEEYCAEYHTTAPFEGLKRAMEAQRQQLLELLSGLKGKVLGYGASTKGNVLLQYCGIDADLIPAIAEVNEEKFGKVTPGTEIPIISEADARKMKPDYFLVLPWHFKDSIIKRERAFLNAGGRLIFPLPDLKIV